MTEVDCAVFVFSEATFEKFTSEPPMMKRTVLSLLFVAALATGTFILLQENDNSQSPTDPNGAMTEGQLSNPHSRKAFELERLKDPATGKIPENIRARELAFASRLPKRAEGRSSSLSWISRGPNNKGGRTRALAIDITNEEVMLAGGVTGGMWRSTDGGESFEKVTSPGDIHSVSCVVQDTRPGQEDTWYYGTGEEFYSVVSPSSFSSPMSGDGIFKSTDGGATWSPLLSTSSNTPQSTLENGSYDFVWNMVIDHTDNENDVVLAAVFNGIIRSEDGGDTWTQVLGFNESPSIFTDVMITPAGVFYATISDEGNGSGFFRSEDGINWVDISENNFVSYRRAVMAYNPQDENEVYFLWEGPSTENSINHNLRKYTYLTGDGSGEDGTWENLSANLPQEACILNIGSDFDFGTFGSQSSFDLCMTHHPTEEDVLYIGGRNIFRSTDGFTSPDNTEWIGGYRCNEANPIDYSYPNHHSDQHRMVFLQSNPDVMYSANDGGVYRTDDAMADSVSWTSLNNGYVTTQFYTVALERGIATSDFVMGGMQDNGTWITNSMMVDQDWKEVHADDGSFCAIPEGRDFVISSSQRGRIYKKELDENGNLVGTERIDPQISPSMLFINPLMLDPQTNNHLYLVANRAIWRMDNVSEIEVTNNYVEAIDNDYWNQLSESQLPFGSGRITSLDIPKVQNSTIYYGTNAGGVWKLENQFDSENDEQVELDNEPFPPNSWVSAIQANPLDADEVIACVSNYNVPSIFHSTDGGETFIDVSGNLEENPDGTGAGPAVYWVEIYPTEPQTYFAATSIGLFSTDNLDGANTTWVQEGPETIGNIVVNMIDSRPWDGAIAIGTHANGIFTSTTDPVPTIGVNESQPFAAKAQAYPNPFTEFINFEYESATAGNTKLEIFDLNGRKVATVTDRNEEAGKHNLRWSPKDVEKGVYFYKLQVGNSQKSGKVIYR
ncbi:T9SS type A sorting domain-containing protein [Halocola ammonii]